jgi:hypothetical protein
MPGSRQGDVVRLADDFESVTVAATAIGGTAAKTARAERAFISAETAEMRFRYDGSDPTSSVGHKLEIGETLVLAGTVNIEQFRAIRTGAVSGVLRITYEV